MKRTIVAIALTLTALAASASPKIGPTDLKDCKLEYPRAALMNEEAGTVIVDVQVDAEGKVTDTKITKASGFKTLDTGTTSQVRKCKVAKPAGTYSIEYAWSLN